MVDGVDTLSYFAYSADSRNFVTTHHDGSVRIWDSDTGQVRCTYC